MPFCCINQHVNSTGKTWCNECESLIAGARVDDYSIISYIGKGNMSAVYLANQLSLNNRKVVIKVLPPVGINANVDDFRREAAMLATLTHPYILPIYSYGIVNERHSGAVTYSPYLVLPYAVQGSLTDIFDREGKRPWPLSRVVPIMEEAAEALDHAHSQGVLHRDVKPANLLQMGSHVMLSDFGVASLIDTNESHLTAAWAGSPGYMAPEVWEYRPGRYSDQYALAVSCYVLLTGEYPWQPATSGGLRGWAHLHRYTEPRPLHVMRPDIPISANKVLQRALAKEPHARYATLKEFAVELKEAQRDNTPRTSSEAVNPLPPTQVRIPITPKPVRPAPVPTQAQAAQQARPPIAPEPIRPAPISTQAQAARPARPSITPEPARLAPVRAQAQAPQNTPEPYGASETFPDTPARNRFREASQTLGSFLQSSFIDHDRWTWKALLLNILLYLVLAGQVFWMFRDFTSVAFFLLAACPALLIGPLVAQMFRGVLPSAYPAGLLFGLLFGIVNTLFSGLACYGVATLWLTFTKHWRIDWVGPGQGLSFFGLEATRLIPSARPLILTFLLLSLLGGAIIGLLVVRGRRKASGY